MKSQKTAMTLVTLVLAALVGYGGMRWYKLAHYPKWFVTVAIGDSKETVIRKMGAPDMVQSRPHWLWCPLPQGDSEFMYGHSVPPEWWVVSFNQAGNVISVAELKSP